MTLRLLAVHAHPDDESSKGAATDAYYLSRGARVMVVSCTGGEAGSILNDGLDARHHADRDIAGLRRHEMNRARQKLGIEHRWLGFSDSGLPDEGESIAANSFAALPVQVAAEPLVRLVRDFRPHVIVSYDENGGYPHPDHIRAHEVTMRAWEASADPSQYPDAGEPWLISKFYYDRTFNGERARAMRDALRAALPDAPITGALDEMIARWDLRGSDATTHIECAEFFDVRDAALRSHASQVAPDSAFFFWPNDIQRDAWPYEDFLLAHSRVESTLPENDLFAGIIDEETVA
ncbi:mycothiol conjugate amidase Mca [Salinibacterium sp. ZJ454]|uniref:mycothiol conjugate amidase Mca n=1 Tax=Salinibacterium sp. ZJ454 TaxID=2708339 RepID=UPI0014232DA8|nr:mycothiol conjugate amidase Mca [Salinibacterium sp. ZJ454]